MLDRVLNTFHNKGIYFVKEVNFVMKFMIEVYYIFQVQTKVTLSIVKHSSQSRPRMKVD